MKRWFVLTVAMIGISALAQWRSVLAVENPPPDIETVMKKVNNNKDGLHKSLGSDLKSDSINWAAMTKKTQDYVTLINALGQFEPPKGDKKSWEKLTKEYAANAKALKDACDKQDKAAATAAHGKISRSCTGCHNAHRG